MVIKIRKRALAAVCVVLLGAALALPHLPALVKEPPGSVVVAGGSICSPLQSPGGYLPAMSQGDLGSERFQRPSKSLPYPNPYNFTDFQKDGDQPPLVTKTFETPEDLILAYYGILREASNMAGFSGGCGTIGQSEQPYPYAYELLTKARRSKLPLKKYVNSFAGVGHTTLLKLLPAYAPPDTPESIRYYMVEVEMITGVKEVSGKKPRQGSLFAYYYGLIAAEETRDGGWKIRDIYYIPEDFLCAPYHSWFYLSDAVVQIVYGDNLELVDRIDAVEQEGDVIRITASGQGNRYRFDFVRLTNGYDILLHEYILTGSSWVETSLLGEQWRDMKLTVENSQLQRDV